MCGLCWSCPVSQGEKRVGGQRVWCPGWGVPSDFLVKNLISLPLFLVAFTGEGRGMPPNQTCNSTQEFVGAEDGRLTGSPHQSFKPLLCFIYADPKVCCLGAQVDFSVLTMAFLLMKSAWSSVCKPLNIPNTGLSLYVDKPIKGL